MTGMPLQSSFAPASTARRWMSPPPRRPKSLPPEDGQRRGVLHEVARMPLRDRRDPRTRRRRKAAAKRKPEPDAEIADHQSPRKRPDAPHDAEARATREHRARRGTDDMPEVRNGEVTDDRRADDQPEKRVDEPPRLVRPAPHAARREKKCRAGETAEREHHHAEYGGHDYFPKMRRK